MAQWVTKYLEMEVEEERRVSAVDGLNSHIGDALESEIKACLLEYNKRHAGPDLLLVPAVEYQRSPHPAGGWQFSIQKHTQPKDKVNIDLPHGKGTLTARAEYIPHRELIWAIQPGNDDGNLDEGTTAINRVRFVWGDNRLDVQDLIKELLSPLLFPQYCFFGED